MDNGWTVSVSNTLINGSSTGLGMTLDMGDAGSLNYESSTGARGIGKIKDMMPTADEDAAEMVLIQMVQLLAEQFLVQSLLELLVSIILKQWIWLKSV